MVCDEGESVWLYLTDVDGRELVADCWLFNTISAPQDLSAYANCERPAPVIARFAGAGARRGLPGANEMSIAWSDDGHDVCIRMAGVPIGFIDARQRQGYSRHLQAGGPFGQRFDDATYRALFG
jgi:hypothetical protein